MRARQGQASAVTVLVKAAPKLEQLKRPGSEATVEKYVLEAARTNDVQALAMLLSLGRLVDGRIESLADELLRSMLPCDAGECAMYLLNYLEELRLRKACDARVRAEQQPDAERKRKREEDVCQRDGVEGRQMLRSEYIEECESHCGAAPNSQELLTLAAEAMQLAPPAERCARALLLQAHRLRKQVPRVGEALKNTDETPLTDSKGNPGIPWPDTRADLPRGLLSTTAGVGGHDLSLGAEAVPLQWVNEVDDAVPPPIVFVRQCIDVDVRQDWIKKPARCCVTEVTATTRGGVDRCLSATFPATKPWDDCECNWDCLARCAREKNCKCIAQCSNRALQRGAPFRLQVFRHETKGWCLRTLTHIPAETFVMEYVAERLTQERSAERLKDDPNIETYIMELPKGGSFSLDALAVRNHAPFAAFACSKMLANLVKRKVYTNVWDPRGTHVGFFSRRAIEPGEELTYLRTDENPTKAGARRICGCGHEKCAGYI